MWAYWKADELGGGWVDEKVGVWADAKVDWLAEKMVLR